MKYIRNHIIEAFQVGVDEPPDWFKEKVKEGEALIINGTPKVYTRTGFKEISTGKGEYVILDPYDKLVVLSKEQFEKKFTRYPLDISPKFEFRQICPGEIKTARSEYKISQLSPVKGNQILKDITRENAIANLIKTIQPHFRITYEETPEKINCIVELDVYIPEEEI